MKIENYDITKLTNDEKSDFEKIFNSIDNYINQKFNYYEYINKVVELNLSEDLLASEREKEKKRLSEDNSYRTFLDDQLYYLKDKLRNNYLNIYTKDDLEISYENISDDDELLNEMNLYKKSYKNITDEFNEIGNFTLNDDNDGKNDKKIKKKTSKNKNKKSHKNITDEFNEIGNFTLNDEDDKNNDKIKKCKFENCNREATYHKLKVGNCHLKDRPKNSINKKFPYKSIFNKVNIPLHYFNHTNKNILNDYHDYIYKTLKNNKFKFPIKIAIYTENLLYDPFNNNMLNEVNIEHIENYENILKVQ